MKDLTINKKGQLDLVCKNCGNNFRGAYCSVCGQRYHDKKFTIKESFGWIFNTVFNLEKGFFFTVKELLFNTHEMLSRYFNRATISYMHAFRFVFLMATISSIVTIFSGAFDVTTLKAGMKGFSDGFADGYNANQAIESSSAEKVAQVQKVMETIKKYFAFILLINIPFYAFFSSLMYRKFKLNYTEHLILNCYSLGLSLITCLPLVLLILLESGIAWYSTLNLLFTLLTFAFVFHRFFKENYFLSLLKALGQYIMFSMVIVIIALVGFFYTKIIG